MILYDYESIPLASNYWAGYVRQRLLASNTRLYTTLVGFFTKILRVQRNIWTFFFEELSFDKSYLNSSKNVSACVLRNEVNCTCRINHGRVLRKKCVKVDILSEVDQILSSDLALSNWFLCVRGIHFENRFLWTEEGNGILEIIWAKFFRLVLSKLIYNCPETFLGKRFRAL